MRQTRIVIAPDKFKGSLTAAEAAEAMARGFRSALRCETTLVPMADGGEGTVEAFLAGGARRRVARVRGPLGEPVDAAFARSDDLAVLEMAAASGLSLLERGEYDPLHASTFGTGELLSAAAQSGARRCIIGIGGSATVDVGTGMMRALGARFLDESGADLGDDLTQYVRLARIVLDGVDESVRSMNISVASDVRNPLTGEDGAAAVFAPQKGASPQDVALLDRIATRIADVTASAIGKDLRAMPGAGAAGGLGFALAAFLGARIEEGVFVIAKERGLDRALEGADLCATGEGRIDMQTLDGKTVAGVAELARRAGVTAVAFGGDVRPDAADAFARRGVECVATASGLSKDDAIARAAPLLERACAQWAASKFTAR